MEGMNEGGCCAQLQQLGEAMQQDFNREALRNLVRCAFYSSEAQLMNQDDLCNMAVMAHDLVALAYTAKNEVSS